MPSTRSTLIRLASTLPKGSEERLSVLRLLVASTEVESAQNRKEPSKVTGPGPARRNDVMIGLIDRGGRGSGKHQNRNRDVEKGHSRKEKHKKPLQGEG